jgi:hypothetical protein
VFSLAERVFFLEYFFSSESFAAVRKAFSNAYAHKEVPNKTKIYRLVTVALQTSLSPARLQI